MVSTIKHCFDEALCVMCSFLLAMIDLFQRKVLIANSVGFFMRYSQKNQEFFDNVGLPIMCKISHGQQLVRRPQQWVRNVLVLIKEAIFEAIAKRF